MFVGLAVAHGDHEHVPEGSAVSEDPIVRVLTWICPEVDPPLTLGRVGLDAMDSYDSHGSIFWIDLSLGNGAGCMFLNPIWS